jgi:hypothetical protein
MININKIILVLIETAKDLGLAELDIDNATSLLDNREYGLAFDTIITQLYEYEIEIDPEFYGMIVKIAQKMKISENEYSFMEELIRTDNIVPKPIKDRLAQLLTSLEPNE